MSSSSATQPGLQVLCDVSLSPFRYINNSLLHRTDSTPQRAAQAAHVAQLEETIADLRSQYEAGQQELASRENAAQNSLSQLTATKQQAAETAGLLQNLQKVYEDQSKELALLQVQQSATMALFDAISLQPVNWKEPCSWFVHVTLSTISCFEYQWMWLMC